MTKNNKDSLLSQIKNSLLPLPELNRLFYFSNEFILYVENKSDSLTFALNNLINSVRQHSQIISFTIIESPREYIYEQLEFEFDNLVPRLSQ